VSHCLSIEVDGQTFCAIVPGNEQLQLDVQDAERTGRAPRMPTPDEIQRALGAFRKTRGVPGPMRELQHP
jgi:prolyl-tRNA editing enzyme YbaK/EbsC (Cys-tRNA(Pro) deacylase)